jgi:hypothetical protein
MLKTYLMNFGKPDVSRVAVFPEFSNIHLSYSFMKLYKRYRFVHKIIQTLSNERITLIKVVHLGK